MILTCSGLVCLTKKLCFDSSKRGASAEGFEWCQREREAGTAISAPAPRLPEQRGRNGRCCWRGRSRCQPPPPACQSALKALGASFVIGQPVLLIYI